MYSKYYLFVRELGLGSKEMHANTYRHTHNHSHPGIDIQKRVGADYLFFPMCIISIGYNQPPHPSSCLILGPSLHDIYMFSPVSVPPN